MTLFLTLVLSSSFVVPTGSWTYPDCTEDTRYEEFGPRADRLLIKMYATLDAECTDMEMCGIDVMDWPLTKPWVDKWSAPPYNDSIKLVDYGCDFDEIVLEMNNNPNQFLGNPPNPAYPNPVYPNPCSVSSFRHALAHLIDRQYIITYIDQGFGILMYTEVPPCLGPYQHPGIYPGGIWTPGEDLSHPFNLTEAARLLNEDGFLIGPDGWRYWDRDQNGIKDPGEELVLKFLIRSDDSKKRHIGEYVVTQLQSDPIKIHVNAIFGTRTLCTMMVMADKDFHLFTGDRNLRKDPDYLYEMKHSQMYWHPGICPNYMFFNNSEYDQWAEQLKFANTVDEAVQAAWKCQEVYATPCKIGSIPIECRYGIKAMKRCYSGTPGIYDEEDMYETQPWKGFVNGYWSKCSCGGAMGINSWWTFLNAYPEGHLMGDCQHMTIRYGFSVPDLQSLNPIYANDYWEWEVMNKIYDTLLKEDPYTLEDIPWMAKNFTVGTYVHPIYGVCTKVKFTLRTDVTWQDGVPFSVADVRFTISELPKKLAEMGYPPPWWHQKVKFVLDCKIIDPCNIEVLFNVNSIWALHWVGELKILPKHIWQPIVETLDPTTFAPDPNLIGCGPWRLAAYEPMVSTLLVANKPSSTVQTGLPGSVPVHSPYGYFRWRPIHVNVHISDPPEYEFAQKVPPNTTFTAKVTLHNEWINPMPNTAGAPPTGLLVVDKYVWLVYPNGTEVALVYETAELPYCVPHEEIFNLQLDRCHHQLKVAVHIKGPPEILVTKEGGTIWVPNPWVCQWINYTYDFWVTIKEDICGDSWPISGEFTNVMGLQFKPGRCQYSVPDCYVNTLDVVEATRAYGSYPGHAKWDGRADITNDYKIDIKDIAAIAKKSGWGGPPPFKPGPVQLVVNPATQTVEMGSSFAVNIDIANVSDLYGHEIKLSYNTTVLDCLQVIKGPFLTSAWPTLFTAKTDEPGGIISISDALMANLTGVNGSGTLATITFNATATGKTALHLFDTQLANSWHQPIGHTAFDGTVEVTRIHDIAITNVTTSKTVVGQGFNITIHVTLQNNGNYTDTFTVWTFCGLHQNITLQSLSSITIHYTFSTSKLKKGTYKVWAYAPMPDDARPNDNIRVGTTFLVSMVGDVDGDGRVSGLDLTTVAWSFGSYPGHPRWNPNTDIDGDNKVSGYDLTVTAKNFGKADP